MPIFVIKYCCKDFSLFGCVCFPIDDVQEAYNLIKDLEPTTPQVLPVHHFCFSCLTRLLLFQSLAERKAGEH